MHAVLLVLGWVALCVVSRPGGVWYEMRKRYTKKWVDARPKNFLPSQTPSPILVVRQVRKAMVYHYQIGFIKFLACSSFLRLLKIV